MCCLQLFRHCFMRHYSQNVQICMCCPGYTPFASPVDAQGEYNIPPKHNKNGGHGGAPFGPAPPTRSVPHQAPSGLPLPKNSGKCLNPALPVPKEPSHPDPMSLLESDDFYVRKTPSPRLPCTDPDSSHGFFNPNPGP